MRRNITVALLVLLLVSIFLFVQVSFLLHDRGSKFVIEKLEDRKDTSLIFKGQRENESFHIERDLILPAKSGTSSKMDQPTKNEKLKQPPVPWRMNSSLSFASFVNKPSTDLSKMPKTWRYDAMMYKKRDLEKRFLTIAIPTIKRQKGDYLLKTLDSVISKTNSIREIYIVVFLADFDENWRVNMSTVLYSLYGRLVDDGTLQIIQAPRSFYPPLNDLRHTYNDPVLKRKWRSKQNADYAFVILYSLSLSRYYMQLEDDVYTVTGYISIIKDYIRSMKYQWVCLEFSNLGFIGKLFPSEHLEKLAKMLLLFYEEQPCDEIVPYFIKMMLQTKRYIRNPSIFQHTGLFSSLPGKIQPLKDELFEIEPKQYSGDNPPAKIYSNMPVNENFTPESAYSLEKGFFWSKRNGKTGDVYCIVFEKPQHVDRIVIETGAVTGTDKIENGVVAAGSKSSYLPYFSSRCSNDIIIGQIQNGHFDVENIQELVQGKRILCLNISVTKNQDWWIIIREVAVFIAKRRKQ